MGNFFLNVIILEMMVDLERKFPGNSVHTFLLATELAGLPALGKRLLEYCTLDQQEYLQAAAGL